MKRYRVAVVGCGPRGDDHVHGFTFNSDRFELVGLCDTDGERLAKVAGRYNVQCTYTDAERMMAETQPDIFCFATLPHIRLPLIELGLKHGVKAIAYEKPMALTLKEAREIHDRCEAAGVKTVVAHAQMYGSHFAQVKQLIDAGEIGEIHTIHATAQSWLLQLGTHQVHYMQWFNGGEAIDWVFGQVTGKDHLADNHPSPDYVFAKLHFANGVNGILECGPLAPSFLEPPMFWVNDSITIHGSLGYARVILGKGWEAVTKGSGRRISGPGMFFPLWDTPPYLRELARWLDDPKKEHFCNGARTYHGFEAAMGICLSSLQRRRVALPMTELPHEPLFDQLVRELPDVPVPPAPGAP